MNPRKRYPKPLHIAGKSRKRKREADLSYHPPGNKRQRTETGKKDILALRAHTNFESLKTSVMIQWDEIDSANKEEAQQLLSPELKKIRSHRPIDSITQFSPSGKASAISTPGGTELLRTTSFGSILFFSDLPKFDLPKDEEFDKISLEFYNSPQYKAIQKIQETIKSQKAKIDATLLNLTRKEYERTHGKRAISQNKTMVKKGVSAKHGSATEYARKAFEFSERVTNMRWEWLHLIAHSILGDSSQHIENLVGGSPFANTDMMIVESQMQYLSELYPEGFTLDVKATLLPGSHIATKIIYSIQTPDFTVPFTFNAQSQTKPHIVYAEYVKKLFDSLVTASKNASSSKLKK